MEHQASLLTYRMPGSTRFSASAHEVADLTHHHPWAELRLGGQGEDVERRLPVVEGQGLPTQEERGRRPLGQSPQALVGAEFVFKRIYEWCSASSML